MKHKKLLCALIIINIAVIWGNSLMPGNVSGAISGWLKDLLNNILGSVFSGSEGMEGDHILRKLGHATEFCSLGILISLWYHFKNLMIDDSSISLTAVFTHPSEIYIRGIIVALCDETIQLFIPGRCGAIKDVWIDTLGFTVGLLIIFLYEIKTNNKNSNE